MNFLAKLSNYAYHFLNGLTSSFKVISLFLGAFALAFIFPITLPLGILAATAIGSVISIRQIANNRKEQDLLAKLETQLKTLDEEVERLDLSKEAHREGLLELTEVHKMNQHARNNIMQEAERLKMLRKYALYLVSKKVHASNEQNYLAILAEIQKEFHEKIELTRNTLKDSSASNEAKYQQIHSVRHYFQEVIAKNLHDEEIQEDFETLIHGEHYLGSHSTGKPTETTLENAHLKNTANSNRVNRVEPPVSLKKSFIRTVKVTLMSMAVGVLVSAAVASIVLATPITAIIASSATAVAAASSTILAISAGVGILSGILYHKYTQPSENKLPVVEKQVQEKQQEKSQLKSELELMKQEKNHQINMENSRQNQADEKISEINSSLEKLDKKLCQRTETSKTLLGLGLSQSTQPQFAPKPTPQEHIKPPLDDNKLLDLAHLGREEIDPELMNGR